MAGRTAKPAKPRPPLNIALVEVKSSNIHSVGYDPKRQVLRIRFHHGGIYDYAKVPAEKYAAFLRAESVGGHFHEHIKGAHEFKKLPAPGASRDAIGLNAIK